MQLTSSRLQGATERIGAHAPAQRGSRPRAGASYAGSVGLAPCTARAAWHQPNPLPSPQRQCLHSPRRSMSARCAATPDASSPAPTAPADPGAQRAAPLGARLGAAYDSLSNMPDWAAKGRRAGVILHPTSLPGPYGIGELGPEALAFLDWLAAAGMQCWQVLPLVPPDPEYFSPYSGLDANCGNPLLISLDALITEGLLAKSDAPAGLKASGDVDFAAVAAAKLPLLSKAAQALLTEPRFAALRASLKRFRASNPWIEDSALFDALRKRPDLENKEWWFWPEPLRLREAGAIKKARAAHAAEIDEFVAVQFL
ncbi:hypothetical protein MNEG_11917, partial [Monoraphidium neglectum]